LPWIRLSAFFNKKNNSEILNALDIFGRTLWKADMSIARYLRAQDNSVQKEKAYVSTSSGGLNLQTKL
jgi:hypothetical protein